MNSRRQSDEPAEHRRFARYLQALQSVAAADETDLLAAVLRDEETSMAVSAVSRHLDRRAIEPVPDLFLVGLCGRSRQGQMPVRRSRRERSELPTR
ncbi:hypothetical protein [Streptomyces sp. NPDC057428]|uniref:hypothetical protein n=1 Tax=Streptomyces sp. NPDC057428 TaxID=3346129 RepID=UPI0036BE0A73